MNITLLPIFSIWRQTNRTLLLGITLHHGITLTRPLARWDIRNPNHCSSFPYSHRYTGYGLHSSGIFLSRHRYHILYYRMRAYLEDWDEEFMTDWNWAARINNRLVNPCVHFHSQPAYFPSRDRYLHGLWPFWGTLRFRNYQRLISELEQGVGTRKRHCCRFPPCNRVGYQRA